MRGLRGWILRLAGLFHRERRDRELAVELESHLQMHIDDHVRRGMDPAEARRRALIQLGGVEQAKEMVRDRRAVPLLDHLLQDVRFAIRILAKTPAITAVALLSLALGIGANTAIFSLIDTVLLRQLPVEKPEELVQLMQASPGQASDSFPSFTNPTWEKVRDRQDVFSGAFAWRARKFDLADGGEAQYVRGLWASGEFFNALGVQPAAGRVFTAADDRRGCSGVAVLGYSFWQQHFAGAQSAIGGLIRIDGHSFPVIGAAPASFFGMEVGDKFDVALPLCAEAALRGKDSRLDNRAVWWLKVAGRLKPGTSLEQATARLRVLAPQIYADSLPPRLSADEQKNFLQSTFATRRVATGPNDPFGLRMRYVRPLEILMAIAGIVLLITCANIASLMLARAAARQKEIAVRLSLGATRARLIRQVLTESFLLSSTGALMGIAFARWASLLLERFVSTGDNKVLLNLSLDSRVLGFTAGVALLTGMVFGILPAMRATRVSPLAAMKGGVADGQEVQSHFRAGRWIVAAQVALSLVLLVGTGLFVRTFRNLTTVEAGFDRNNVLLVKMNVLNSGISKDARAAFYAQVLEKLKMIPGAVSASQSWFTPLSGSEWNQDIKLARYQPPDGVEPLVWFNWIAPQYFRTMRTPVLVGREFDSRDTAGSPRVAVVNQAMARRFFPQSNPIGKTFVIEQSSSATASAGPIEIVGVVADSKYESFREDFLPFGYVPASQLQFVSEETSFEIRSSGNPVGIAPAVRDAMTAANRSVSLEFNTLSQRVDDTMSQERVLATLSGFFGALALLLTAVGLYGVMSYIVTRRTHEIGIRMALGAAPRAILRLVMRDVAALLAAGMGAGILVSFWLTRLVQRLLFGITAHDSFAIAGAVALLAAVALAAGYLPARRAMRVDPMVALRHE